MARARAKTKRMRKLSEGPEGGVPTEELYTTFTACGERSASSRARRRTEVAEERRSAGVWGVRGEKGLPEVRGMARAERAAEGARGVRRAFWTSWGEVGVPVLIRVSEEGEIWYGGLFFWGGGGYGMLLTLDDGEVGVRLEGRRVAGEGRDGVASRQGLLDDEPAVLAGSAGDVEVHVYVLVAENGYNLGRFCFCFGLGLLM